MEQIDYLEKRIKRIRFGLTQPGEAAIILSNQNRLYLTGFKSSAGLVLITRSSAYFIVDFRYGEAAKQNIKHIDVIVYTKLSDTLEKLCKKHCIKKTYFENEGITLAQAELYKSMLKACEVKCSFTNYLDKIINNLRIIKTQDEIEKLEEAQRITEDAYLEILNYIKPGVTERDIALELEYLMRKKGADGVAFDLITITGTNTSKPHGVPGNTVINSGDFFTMDIGVLFDGYHSDMTRTVAVGSVSDEQEKIYNIVLNAQTTALAQIKPGVSCASVDAAARDVIIAEGYGECFGHSTGHGVGLDIHEFPAVSVNNSQILSEGMVITCEPGIYLPEKFGVRIEDMVLLTQDGMKNFTNVTKELIIL
ncbi:MULTISPECIES: aminopeptidase P family protein [unclassified Ruminococcus]|uniref:aminopeptidase P family protein n=1 Tax=unclassified Ruminococcus TaxID=2608920 RepID=UPI00210AE239|nr:MULTISPECIES: aminopeptidase P family protein [unclassified Ruminococcus]MCQ4021645.1 M24 family metallopeptidase [Ruminococcus sp. zg-924]MCQ4114090.1 M24 family metallopeptidase [Ruminococcus sp. zg-921]